jgi:hypothetical protein
MGFPKVGQCLDTSAAQERSMPGRIAPVQNELGSPDPDAQLMQQRSIRPSAFPQTQNEIKLTSLELAIPLQQGESHDFLDKVVRVIKKAKAETNSGCLTNFIP